MTVICQWGISGAWRWSG